MSSLRRDLFERRLWPVVAVVLAAILTVPVLLLHHHATAQADTGAPPPSSATSAPAPSSTAGSPTDPGQTVRPRGLPVDARRTLIRAKTLRDPFTAARLSDHPSWDKHSSSSSASTTASTTATTASTTATTTSDSPPSPVGGGQTLAAPADGTSERSDPTSVVTSTTASATVSPTTSTTSGTVTSVATTYPAAERAWTIYSVDIGLAATGRTVTPRTDVPRLTPLPSAADPKVMFIGVARGGNGAIFMLGAGVTATGAAICRPDHARCSAIEVVPRQAETLTVPTASGGTRTLRLTVTRIAHRTTRSKAVALTAYRAWSQTGLCELLLANPYVFDAKTGAVTSMVSSPCRHASASVPFPGAVN